MSGNESHSSRSQPCWLSALPTAVPARADITDVPKPARPIPGETIPNPPLMDLVPGSSGSQVTRLQEELTEAGFFRGKIDGVFGGATLGAVYAFQKLYGMERTGTFRAEDWSLLDREIKGPGPGSRTRSGRGRPVAPASLSHRGRRDDRGLSGLLRQRCVYRNASGRTVRANTPEGRFTFQRSRGGWWESYLGFLYRPFYFYGGYAIHGSRSVPPFPASHGCVRVHIEDMDYLATRLSLGMPIYVYGDDIGRDALITPAPCPRRPTEAPQRRGWSDRP